MEQLTIVGKKETKDSNLSHMLIPKGSIFMTGGIHVDEVKIDNQVFGSNEGHKDESIQLGRGENIIKVIICWDGAYINYLRFETSSGQHIEAGTPGPGKTEIKGRVLALQFKSGRFIDQVSVLHLP